MIDEKRSESLIKKYGSFAPRASYRFYEVKVRVERDNWPEAHKRDRKWMTYRTAKELLQDRPELLEALERSSIRR